MLIDGIHGVYTSLSIYTIVSNLFPTYDVRATDGDFEGHGLYTLALSGSPRRIT